MFAEEITFAEVPKGLPYARRRCDVKFVEVSLWVYRKPAGDVVSCNISICVHLVYKRLTVFCFVFLGWWEEGCNLLSRR